MVMSTLKRDDILKVQDITVEKVEVPEWGGDVYVKALTGTERDLFEASIIETHGQGKSRVRLENIRAKLVALSACDEKGERLFSAKDAEALGKKSAAALQRVFVVVQRLSGLTTSDVEELAKGLKENPFGDSPSA